MSNNTRALLALALLIEVLCNMRPWRKAGIQSGLPSPLLPSPSLPYIFIKVDLQNKRKGKKAGLTHFCSI